MKIRGYMDLKPRSFYWAKKKKKKKKKKKNQDRS